MKGSKPHIEHLIALDQDLVGDLRRPPLLSALQLLVRTEGEQRGRETVVKRSEDLVRRNVPAARLKGVYIAPAFLVHALDGIEPRDEPTRLSLPVSKRRVAANRSLQSTRCVVRPPTLTVQWLSTITQLRLHRMVITSERCIPKIGVLVQFFTGGT